MKLSFLLNRLNVGNEADPVDAGAGGMSDGGESEAVRGLSNLYFAEDNGQAAVESDMSRKMVYDLADVLLDMGKISDEQYKQVRVQAEKIDSGLSNPVEKVLKGSGFVNDEDILRAKAKLRKLEFIHIDPARIDKGLLKSCGLDFVFITDNYICPVEVKDGKLIVATTDPENLFLLEKLKRKVRTALELVVCTSEDLKAGWEVFNDKKTDYSLDDIISDMGDFEVVQEEQKDFEDLEEMAGQSPVIKFVNYLISNAIKEGASDIHIEPKSKYTRIRYRIDGVLFEMMQSPINMHPALVSRIKIMANLDISERRLPQDGKISVILGSRGIDLRISTLPTNQGEKVVIRVLDSKSIMRGLETLGMEPEMTDEFSRQVAMPNGIFLVTGPTGSGKSTTLYSALGQMDGNTMNISTVEDPVEYELGFCNQVQVLDRIGFTFSSALRSLLRQDPDIIMIGEIRDQETAKIAVQAALTGHLVLSTLHTNDAPSSITRLVNIGIDTYLLAASLNAVLAQRLVRRICPNCKENYIPPASLLGHLEKAGVVKQQLFHGAGCEHCRNSGYAGRVGIYEMLVINDNFRDMINRDASVIAMRNVFRENNGKSLFDDGISKIKRGLTTIDEVIRVTQVSDQQ